MKDYFTKRALRNKDAVMRKSKKDCLESIKDELGVDDEEAQEIFKRALENEDIVLKIHWPNLVTYVIWGTVGLMLLWALYRVI